MGWADNYIKKLQAGETVQFRPRGNSMAGMINNGDLVTVAPYDGSGTNWVGLVGKAVLCKIGRHQYVHKVYAVLGGRAQIGNNKGHINGWTDEENIFGVVTEVKP